MSDDYLWDGSGEADPEVERLEQLLKKYRYQPRPLTMPVRSPRVMSPRLAVAAALIVIALAALGVFVINQRSLNRVADAVAGLGDKEKNEATGSEVKAAPEKQPAPASVVSPVQQRLAAHKTGKRGQHASTKRGGDRFINEDNGFDSANGSIEANDAITATMAAIDMKAASHFERAQLLLRSFRNAEISDNQGGPDVSYEKEQSRNLVYENIILRRDAEAKGSVQVESVLSSLEPFLLDIANLPDHPSSDEVKSIKERIQKKEIVATLQVYSSQNIIAINP